MDEATKLCQTCVHHSDDALGNFARMQCNAVEVQRRLGRGVSVRAAVARDVGPCGRDGRLYEQMVEVMR